MGYQAISAHQLATRFHIVAWLADVVAYRCPANAQLMTMAGRTEEWSS